MKSTTTVLSVMCSVALFQSCNSIKCYSCLSDNDVGCDKITDDKYLKDFPEYDECSVVIISMNGKIDTVQRNCEQKENKVEFKFCSTDRCNGNDGVVTTDNTTAGDTIKCYSCSSFLTGKYHNPKCEKIVGDNYLKNCKSGEECSKFEILNQDNTVKLVDRECKPKGYKLEKIIRCDTDKCNGNHVIVTIKNEH